MVKNVYENLSKDLIEGKESALLTFMKHLNPREGSIEKKLHISKASLLNDTSTMDPELQKEILNTFHSGIPHLYHRSEEASILIEPYFPRPRLIILGGGHIAKPLCEFGFKVGFSVIVADDRPTFANANRFPEADEVICEDFQRVFDTLKLRESDFVVIVTRGHRHDGVCLRNTLKSHPAYIGMIGSKRRVREMMSQLIEEGYDQERLNTVHSPIGLSIGAVTPDEIAVSIIAEVIGCRRALGTKLSNNNKFNWPEFDADVINQICVASEVPRALITIIASKGSVPRKAGAKMIVWLDGRTMGSIGGGCSEANIATLSRDVILNQRFSIEHVDMTGLAAEDEGMVCGGTMEVLIESI